MLPRMPGQSAMVLVALAWIGGTPTISRAGKLKKLPPPATEFIMPPTTAAANRKRAWCRLGTEPLYARLGPLRAALQKTAASQPRQRELPLADWRFGGAFCVRFKESCRSRRARNGIPTSSACHPADSSTPRRDDWRREYQSSTLPCTRRADRYWFHP